MAQQPLSDEACQVALDAVEKYGTIKAAAEALGISRTTLQHRVNLGQARRDRPPVPTAESLPPEDLPTEQIIDLMRSRFNIRAANAAARDAAIALTSAHYAIGGGTYQSTPTPTTFKFDNFSAG